MSTWIKRGAIASVLLVLLLAGAVLFWVSGLNKSMEEPYRDWTGDSVDVVIPQGSSVAAALAKLEEQGVMASAQRVRYWLRLFDKDASLQAGEYRFSEAASPKQVMTRLAEGDILLHPVTIPEGLRVEQVAELLANAELGDSETFLRLFSEVPESVLKISPDSTNLDGFIQPDTYNFARGTPPERVRDRMVERFFEIVDDDYAAAAEARGLTVRQAVVLASLIEKETSLPEERPRISRVFHNRIRLGMKMQCDPTVRYALMRDGKPVSRLTYADLRYPSPWNTYVSEGLPPTPIASPGEASLRAAVEPIDSEELYFVAKPDGGHTFSESLAEHNRAVAVWRRYERSQGV